MPGVQESHAVSGLPAPAGVSLLLTSNTLGKLVAELVHDGYEVLGPTLRDGAIVFGEIHDARDLPAGYSARQGPGSYRLQKRKGHALFGYANTGNTAKSFLHAPEVRLLSSERLNGEPTIAAESPRSHKYAFLGLRACDVAAIRIQDKVLLEGRFSDEHYAVRRREALLIAVHCTDPAATCFCDSMKTGPRCTSGSDIALTEMTEGGQVVYVAEAGSAAGARLLAGLGLEKAPDELVSQAEKAVSDAAKRMNRRVELEGLRELLYDNFEHPEWEQASRRCLACGNCTMVCPTCFCVTIDDTTDVLNRHAERQRRWDSCFTQSFTYIHGGSVRLSEKSRYRHRITHKLAAWQDQFGTPGCVGCGRCITWCPVGLDFTEEVARIRNTSAAAGGQGRRNDQE